MKVGLTSLAWYLSVWKLIAFHLYTQTRLQTALDDCAGLHDRLLELQEATRQALLLRGGAEQEREGAVP